MRGNPKHKRYSIVCLTFFFLTCGVGYTWAAWADTPQVAVIYPEIREPFLSVFKAVISGIENKLPSAPKTFQLKKDQTASDLEAQLKEDNIGIIITLGKKGLMVGKGLSPSYKIVAGAVRIPSDFIEEQAGKRINGITLTPDPMLMLGHLRHLAPKVKQVTVVYNPKHSNWLIRKIEQAATAFDFTLNALPADNLKSAASVYKDVLSSANKDTDAIWLLRDSSVLDERAIMPMILSEAWTKHLVVISNNPGHVRKGAFFSLYPDNTALGQSLAMLAQEIDTTEENIVPLKDVLTAVNIRTAGHLGIHFSSQDKRGFSMLFPSR